MKKWLKLTLAIACLVLLYYVSVITLTYYHENVHVAIYDSYGIKSEAVLNYLDGSGKTYAEEPCPIDSQCDVLHNWNEIITYNLTAFVDNLWAMLLFVLVWMTFVRRIK